MAADWGATAFAGLVAAVAAAVAMWPFRALGGTRFSPALELGCLLLDDPRRPATETVGFGVFLALGVLLLPPLYAGAMAAAGGAGGGTGALAGALHGAAAAALLPRVARASRCVRLGRVPPPGPLGLAWGRATPAALVTGHAAYGATLGAILAGV